MDQRTDRAALRTLVSAADVLIESFPAPFAAELGLDARSLSAVNPRLVSCSIGGYRPDDRRPAGQSGRPARKASTASLTGAGWVMLAAWVPPSMRTTPSQPERPSASR